MPGPKTVRVHLDEDQKRDLKSLSRKRSVSKRVRERTRIVLACDGGISDVSVAKKLRVSVQRVGRCRKRYLENGLEGLHDQPRSGRARLVTEREVERIVTTTLSPPPDGRARWTLAATARATGWSESTIGRVWRRCGLRPDRLVCSRFHPDMMLYGAWSVVGVYQHSGLEAIAITLDAQWSGEVAPFWSSEADHRGRTGRVTPPMSGHVQSSSGGAGGSSSFNDFLDAVTPLGSGRHLFLAVNGVQLHQAALLRQWRAGSGKMHVNRLASDSAWRAAGRQLAAMIALRWPNCEVHGHYRRVAAALRELPQQYVVWSDCHDSPNGSMSTACQCPVEPVVRAGARNKVPSIRWGRQWYSRCRCNQRSCPDCCKRRYRRVRAELCRAWREAVGTGPVLVLTLTYRASAAFTPEEWLERANHDLDSLRRQWKRDWDDVPLNVWSLEFTARGTPHFNVMVPWEGDQHQADISSWLRRTWSKIVGCGLTSATRAPKLVHIQKWGAAWRAIDYILKSIRLPWPERPVPPGTPNFRSWGCSRKLSLYRHKKRAAIQT